MESLPGFGGTAALVIAAIFSAGTPDVNRKTRIPA
jgi:hypothetical protein